MKRAPKKRNAIKRVRQAVALAPRVISFRLDENESQLLQTKAGEQGLSSHQFAHDLVITTMQQDAGGKCPALVGEQIEAKILSLRAELCLVAEVLLIGAGKLTKEAAAEWVDSNLKPD